MAQPLTFILFPYRKSRGGTFVRYLKPRLGKRHRESFQNLFARHSRFPLIKLPETIALHAYAKNIQN